MAVIGLGLAGALALCLMVGPAAVAGSDHGSPTRVPLGVAGTQTFAASSITLTSAQMSAQVQQGASPITWWFRYWPTLGAYPASAVDMSGGTVAAGSGTIQVGATATGLTPNTGYNFKIVTQAQGGPVVTHNIVTFTTLGDTDGDGVADPSDNCPAVANPDQANTDGDTMGNACDDDDDNDTVVDSSDNCALVPNTDQANTDGDALGNACDDDDDNDTVVDSSDNCALVPNTDQANTDGDALGNACDPDIDGDGVLNGPDNCVTTPNPSQTDADRDGLGDACDGLLDRDHDGVADSIDNCPSDSNPGQEDTDGDGVGNVCDGLQDADHDGVGDAADNCPTVPNKSQSDVDRDGLGDACDPDRDGDGVANGADNCPQTYNPGQEDANGDGTGDVCEPPPPPVTLESFNAAGVTGRVTVQLPGESVFQTLGPEAQFPLGAVINATKGKVKLKTTRRGGHIQSVVLQGGTFKVGQKQKQRLITTIQLLGGDFSVCEKTTGRRGLQALERRRRTPVRLVWGSGHGEFRTGGTYAAGVSRGTIWLTIDYCDGTLFRVIRGTVSVLDFGLHKTINVHAGDSYFARAR